MPKKKSTGTRKAAKKKNTKPKANKKRSVKKKAATAGRSSASTKTSRSQRKASKSLKKVSKRPARRVLKANNATSLFSEDGVDLSAAIVTFVFFDDSSIELTLENVMTAKNQETCSAVLCFEAIRGLDQSRYDWGVRLSDAFGKKMYRPQARLTKLSGRKSGKNGPWHIEFTLAPLRKPFTLKCKRLRLKSSRGRQIAGDPPRDRSRWSNQDYLDFANRFCESVRDEDYSVTLSLLHSTLRRRYSVEKLEKQFGRWKRVPSWADAPPNRFHVNLVYSDLGRGSPPEETGRVDRDLIHAEFAATFVNQFLMEAFILSEDNKLTIGRFTPHREW